MPEFYLPSLLDRLQDDHPRSSGERSGRQGISLADYRRMVVRDLDRLLNHASYFNRPLDPAVGSGPQPAAMPMAADYPLVAESVLNYGLEIPAGTVITGDIFEQVKDNIRKAIECFEPRVTNVRIEAAGTAEWEASRAASPGKSDPGKYSILIVTELIADPFPVSLHLRTELDLISGKCQLPEAVAE